MASSRSHSRNASRSASRSSIPRERSRSRQRSFSPRSRSRSDSLSRKRKADAPQNNGYVNEHDDKWSPRRSPHRRDRSEDLSRSRSRSPQRSSKVVVERLTKNVREGHLREIFEVYGQLKDVDLPMNQQFMTNRGSAYIVFEQVADAETAIKHMHESQLDGAVINVSMVLPRRRFSRSPEQSRRVSDFLDKEAARRGPNTRMRPYGSDLRYRSSPPPRRPSPTWATYPTASRGRSAVNRRQRPRSYSRSRSRSPRRYRSPSPRRQRSRSPRRSNSRSQSRSPSLTTPPQPRGHFNNRDQASRGRAGPRRSSPSYSSYGSQSDRSRSRSRSRERTHQNRR